MAITQAVSDPEVKAKIEEQGADVRASSSAEARGFIANEIERWGQVIRQNDIRADS